MLVQGLIRRIGDGQTTHIRRLPGDFMMKPKAPLITNPPQVVLDLIDETSASWKKDLV
jgi:hypothetical protein